MRQEPAKEDLHVLRGPAAVHRPREPPLGAPERAAHGRREAAGRAPRLQTPQVTIPPRPPDRQTDRQHNSLNIEGISEEIRRTSGCRRKASKKRKSEDTRASKRTE